VRETREDGGGGGGAARGHYGPVSHLTHKDDDRGHAVTTPELAGSTATATATAATAAVCSLLSCGECSSWREAGHEP